jgi:putative transport protein
MKWLPGLSRVNAPDAAREFERSVKGEHAAPLPGTAEAGDVTDMSITVRAYRVPATTLAGMTVGQVRGRAPLVSVELVRHGSRWVTPSDTTTFETGDEVVVGAPLTSQTRVREVLGPELPDAEARTLLPIRTVDVVLSRDDAAGRTLPDLTKTMGPGFYPNAVFRAGVELPAGAETTLKKGDVIRVTGTEPRLATLEQKIGHVVRATYSSDILTLALGLLVGAFFGAIPVPIFGLGISVGAATMLVAGILFGWLKTRHPALGGPISEGGRRLLEEMGLNVFTAVLAINSGLAVYHVITQGPVWSLIVSCLIVSAVPAAVAWWFGRHVLGLNAALLMGAIAGARQNTASLRAAQKETDSSVPGIGYPVPLAISTVSLSVAAYFLAIFT